MDTNNNSRRQLTIDLKNPTLEIPIREIMANLPSSENEQTIRAIANEIFNDIVTESQNSKLQVKIALRATVEKYCKTTPYWGDVLPNAFLAIVQTTGRDGWGTKLLGRDELVVSWRSDDPILRPKPANPCRNRAEIQQGNLAVTIRQFENDLSDITLKFGNHTFRSCKSWLASQSGHFKRMFFGQLQGDKGKNEISLDVQTSKEEQTRSSMIDQKTLLCMFNFIHGRTEGLSELSLDELIALGNAACEYQIPALIEVCVGMIWQSADMTIQQIISLSQLADLCAEIPLDDKDKKIDLSPYLTHYFLIDPSLGNAQFNEYSLDDLFALYAIALKYSQKALIEALASQIGQLITLENWGSVCKFCVDNQAIPGIKTLSNLLEDFMLKDGRANARIIEKKAKEAKANPTTDNQAAITAWKSWKALRL